MKALERIRRVPVLPPRKPDTHKGDYGRVLVLAGSTGLTGAGSLCAFSCLRAGAGLVTIAVPATLYPIFAAKLTSPMARPIADSGDGNFSPKALDEALRLAEKATVAAIGPGIGTTSSTERFVLGFLEKTKLPVVVDADALNILAKNPGALGGLSARAILSPHPGEMARLVNLTSNEVQARRLFLATDFAARHSLTLILKGHRSIVTDGARYFINHTGNPGMATAGSGDVLTGVVAALVAQGLSLFDAALLGTYVHGLAGDIAARVVGEISLVAEDIMGNLPKAFLALSKRPFRRTPRRGE